MIYALIVAYTIWAIYSGYKVMSGRSEWLDKRAPLNMIVKAVVCTIVGYVIGVFYLILLIIRLVVH